MVCYADARIDDSHATPLEDMRKCRCSRLVYTIDGCFSGSLHSLERRYRDAKYKLLERGTFQLLTTTNDEEDIELDYSQLVKLLGGLDLRTGRRRRRYRRTG